MPRMPTPGRSAPPAPQTVAPVWVDCAAGRFRLRSLKPQDVRPDWVEWISDPAIAEGLNAAARLLSIDELKNYVARFDQHLRNLIGIFTATNALIGLVLIEVDPRSRNASVHMLVGNKRYWGRGAAIAAGEAVTRHCFDDRQMEKVLFCPLANNQPAIAVCLYHELDLEGIFRSHRASRAGGRRLDQLQFAITREEYSRRKAERGEA